MIVAAGIILLESDLDFIAMLLAREQSVSADALRSKIKRLADCPRPAPGRFKLVEIDNGG